VDLSWPGPSPRTSRRGEIAFVSLDRPLGQVDPDRLRWPRPPVARREIVEWLPDPSPPRGLLHYICIGYSLRRYRMSVYIATNVETQYGPHHALLVMPNQTRHRNGITGRTMAKAIS
jgi:hypothetical protein